LPLVWNLVMDSLLTQMRNTAITPIGYADHILLLIRGKDIHIMASVMNDCLKTVGEWSRSKGLTFNPTKTSVVIFKRSRKAIEDKPMLYLYGKCLSYNDSMKNLGVMLAKD